MTKIMLCFLSTLLVTGSVLAKPAKTLPVKHLLKIDPIAEAKKDVILEIDGRIYPKDAMPTNCPDILKGVKCEADSFGKYHVEAKREGELIHSSAVFSAPEGPQVIEESWEKNGHVQKARIENKALGKVSEIERRGDKVYYKVTESDGKVKESDDDYEENLVVPSTTMSYIRPYFDKIAAGEKIKLRVAVLDRREAFTFYIEKIRSEKAANGDDVMVLKMSPGSIIVKALVSPMFFYINPKKDEMFAFEGRSALRRKEGDKYKELDVKAVYEYKINAFANGKVSARNDATQTEKCTDGGLLGTGKEAKCEVKSQ